MIDKVTTGNVITNVKLKDSDKAKEQLYRYFTNIDNDSQWYLNIRTVVICNNLRNKE